MGQTSLKILDTSVMWLSGQSSAVLSLTSLLKGPMGPEGLGATPIPLPFPCYTIQKQQTNIFTTVLSQEEP